LNQYDFQFQHRQGTKHTNADALSRTPSENQLCQHQKDGKLDPDCTECNEWKQEWTEFNKKIDNVKNLTDWSLIRNVKHSDESPSSNWLSKYTTKELSTFQKEDPDYSNLHNWMDTGHVPDRDKCASVNPAVRCYWLNWSNLLRIDGVIYQKWREAKSEQDHLQLLCPPFSRKRSRSVAMILPTLGI